MLLSNYSSIVISLLSDSVKQDPRFVVNSSNRYCRLGDTHGLRLSLLEGLRDSKLMTEMKALYLVDRMVTGPWMTLFYGNSNKLSNLQMVGYSVIL